MLSHPYDHVNMALEILCPYWFRSRFIVTLQITTLIWH